MRAATLAAIAGSGCFVGVGPSISIRPNGGVRAGWELSDNIFEGGFEVGQSYPIGGGSPMGYAGIRALVPANLDFSTGVAGLFRKDTSLYTVASVGGYGDGDNYPFYGGASVLGATGIVDGCESTFVPTFELGVRWLSGLELFVRAKANMYLVGCPHYL